jgi:ferredoxin--NADP+ reductase
VGWYNGHPDHQDHVFDLSCESVAVVGIGNVAIDVARILARDPESLAKTDIASGALDQLRRSQVRTVWLLGRRGAAEAAFSPAEIEELGDLGYADLVVRAEDVAVDDSSEVSMADVNVKKKVEYLRKHAKLGEGKSARKIRLRLMVSPVEILGEDGRVTDLRMEHNTLTADAHGRLKAVGTGHQETIPVGMVLRSVGYRGRPLSGVPFDEKTGTIANSQGRVTDGVSGPPLPGEYAVGWAKRGPSGLIGTNRADSVATVNLMVLDLKVGKLPARRVDASLESIPKLLTANKIRWIDFQHWEKLDAIETAKGKAAGKPRQKFTRIDEMLAAIKKS